jgi:hypothetical protein
MHKTVGLRCLHFFGISGLALCGGCREGVVVMCSPLAPQEGLAICGHADSHRTSLGVAIPMQNFGVDSFNF